MAGVLFTYSEMERLIKEKGLNYWDDYDDMERHIQTKLPLTDAEKTFVTEYMSVMSRYMTVVFDE